MQIASITASCQPKLSQLQSSYQNLRWQSDTATSYDNEGIMWQVWNLEGTANFNKHFRYAS